MLDVEACLAVCTDEVSDGSQRISGDRQAFTGKVPQGADQMYAASNAFQKDKAVYRRRSLRVVSSNKGKVLTDSRDGFSGEHRDIWPLCPHCRRQALNYRNEGLARMRE